MRNNQKFHKLWKKLNDLNMTTKELEILANLPRFTVFKMKVGVPVSLECLTKICNVFHCELSDILDIEEEKENEI